MADKKRAWIYWEAAEWWFWQMGWFSRHGHREMAFIAQGFALALQIRVRELGGI